MEKNNTSVEVIKLQSENVLYHKYPQQTQAQPVEVELDCETGKLGIGVNGEIGNGVPFEVYHRRTLRWGTLPLKTEVANEMLEDLAPLAQKILDGYSTSWDGHNYVGEYTAEAQAAIEELGEQIDLVDHVEENQIRVWDANDWFAEQGWKSVAAELGVTPATTDEELSTIAAKVTEEAESSGYCDLLTRADKYLEWLREKVIEASDD